MESAPLPSRARAWPAYAIAGLAMLLWVAAALPAGAARGVPLLDDASTPLARQSWVLIPALVLLILGPVGMTLTAARQGQLMLLAATDAFLTLYAGLVLLVRTPLPDPFHPRGVTAMALAFGLLLLGVLSIVETRRLLQGRLGPPSHRLGGLRLALCLLVLVLPAWLLLARGQELASLLAPYLYVALSAGGARLARSARGLSLTAALLHLALGAHVLITLRYSIYAESPAIATPSPAGRTALDLAWALLAMAVVQVLVHLRPERAPRPGWAGEPGSALGAGP